MPLFLVALLWPARAPGLALAPAYVLGAGVIAVIPSLVHSAFYLPRNAPFLYVAMSFIIALAGGDLVRKTLANRSTARICASLGLGLALAVSALYLAGNLPPLGAVFFVENGKHAMSCNSIGAIGLEADELRLLRETARGSVAVFSGVRGPFKIQATSFSPGVVRRLSGGQKPTLVLAEEYQRLRQYDCLVVRRKGQTKQLTNHFAPQHYQLDGRRVGNLFFFKKK